MSPRTSGWYDDPRDDELLRYFDGIVWTEHTALKRPRPAPAPEHSAGTGQVAAGGATSVASAGRPPRHDGPPPADGIGSGWNRAGHPVGRPPMGGTPGPWGPAPGPARAVDGVPRSGWWRRVAAFILDNIVVSIVATPFVLPHADEVMNGYRELLDGAAAGRIPAASQDFTSLLLVLSLTTVVISVVYEVLMLLWRGATVGKMLLGIRVRRIDDTGPVTLGVALRRTVVKFAGSIVGNVPVLGFFGDVFQIADWLWPLGDRRRQALHDKTAATEVVVGRSAAQRRGQRAGAHRSSRRQE